MKLYRTGFIQLVKIFLTITFPALLLSCGGQQAQTDEDPVVGTPVRIIHPQQINFTKTIDMNANTVFLRKEMVRATFRGFVETIHKNVGDDVHKGDLLVTIKTKESAADDSVALNIGAEMFRGSVKILAHSDGVLTLLNFHSGDYVSEGEEIAVISNPSSLRISLNVPYAYVSKISPKISCQLILPDGQTVPAKISKIIPSVDPISQTQTFLLLPEKMIDLPENLNVTARLPLKTVKKAVVLPRSAVLSNETQEKFWIMKLIDDSTAVKTNVQKGIENDSLIQITSPTLSPNDRIISEGGFGLPDSVKVSVSE